MRLQGFTGFPEVFAQFCALLLHIPFGDALLVLGHLSTKLISGSSESNSCSFVAGYSESRRVYTKPPLLDIQEFFWVQGA